jgi:hypothetical protein
MPAISLLNAKIYFKEIRGVPKANTYQNELSKIRYIDVRGDNGNLIKTDDGELYIVDTEPKYFNDHLFLLNILFNNSKTHNEFLKSNISYVNERHKRLNGSNDIYTIPIKKI